MNKGIFPNGKTNVLVPALLVAILLAVVGLIAVLLLGKSGPEAPPRVGNGVLEGETASGGDLPSGRGKPEAINKSERIRETAIEGKTYNIVVNGGFESRVEDKAWVVTEVINLGFTYEMQVLRTIESNDGREIKEVREFHRVATVKILSEGSIDLDFGVPGTLVLSGLEFIAPGTGVAIMSVIPATEYWAGIATQAAVDAKAAKVLGELDGLTGKKVKITYVDGEGVTEITPIGCSLTEDQLAYVADTAALSDCYILPDVDLKPGESWLVDGSQFSGFLDPSMRAVPRGTIEFERVADQASGESKYANMKIRKGVLTLDNSDAGTSRIGTFEPEGDFIFNLTKGHLETAQFGGRFFIESVSKDHILFETRFRSKPTLTVHYKCLME